MNDKPTIIVNTPQHKDSEETYASFKAELEGSYMCGCDHGCNQWIARNGAKILAIMEALEKGAPKEELDGLAKKNAQEYGTEIYEQIKQKAFARRKKNEEDRDQ